MKSILLAQVERAVNGALVGPAGCRNSSVTGVTTDSRGALRGKLFIPLTGVHHNGHDYIPDAFANGASACLSERELDAAGGPVIIVQSTARALQDLAMYYKSLFPVKTVAITGSVGKTTTKDMTAAVLAEGFHVLKTEGNFNNEIGLPLTVFRLEDRHEYAVLEMGMNHAGEIRNLSWIARPDICVITNIGESHMEHLGSREGILEAKSEIFEYMQPPGTVILNGDDDMLLTLKPRFPRALFYGLNKGNDITAREITENGLLNVSAEVRCGGGRFSLTVPLPGRHMLRNALAAVAVGVVAGLGPEEIRRGIGRLELTGMRMEFRRRKDGAVIINDAYNASPSSMKAAIDILAGARGRKVCILGDMFELGPQAGALHGEVGGYAAARGADVMIFVGEHSRQAFLAAGEGRKPGSACLHYKTVPALQDELPGLIRPGDTVLVKASRGMAFESVVNTLLNGKEIND